MILNWIKLAVVALGTIIPAKHPIHAPIYVDLIEINHVHRKEDGLYVYTQIVYWNEYELPEGRKLRVVGFTIIDSRTAPQAWPLKMPGGLYESIAVRYVEGLNKEMPMKIYSKFLRESWTSHDIEIEARKAWGTTDRYQRPNPFDIRPKKPVEPVNPFLLPGDEGYTDCTDR